METIHRIVIPGYTNPKTGKRHEEQKRFVESATKRKIVKAGRRGGKTIGCGKIALHGFRDGKRVLYGAPTVEQVGAFWHFINTVLEPVISEKILFRDKNLHIIEVPNTDIRIKAKTAWNADTLRGDWADILILDEFQLMNEDAWEIVGAPMLLDNNGDAVFIFTPPSFRMRGVTKAFDPRHASKMFKKAQKDTSGRWEAFHFTSYANPFIDERALDEIAIDMTQLAYKQEILAEDIDDVPGALWTQAIIDNTRVSEAPRMKRIVVGVDPQGKKKDSSETGIIVAGLGYDNHGYVLADYSINARPEGWAESVTQAFEENEADRVIAEKNYGGDMVKSVIQSAGPNLPVRLITASRGKTIRAEPISFQYEEGNVHHVGIFPKLEDEMCTYTPGSGWSPNRMDALVWALKELLPIKGRVSSSPVKLGEPRPID